MDSSRALQRPWRRHTHIWLSNWVYSAYRVFQREHEPKYRFNFSVEKKIFIYKFGKLRPDFAQTGKQEESSQLDEGLKTQSKCVSAIVSIILKTNSKLRKKLSRILNLEYWINLNFRNLNIRKQNNITKLY